MEFNEDEAIKYIINALGDDYAHTDEDEILNIIDIIWDYYDENGLLNIDAEGDEDAESEDIIAYAKRVLAKDRNCPFNPDEIEKIVRAELEYESKAFDI